MAFDSCTGMWWVTYKKESDDEKGGIFCLLCKKYNTANLKNNSKVYILIPAQHLKTDRAKSAQHAAAVQAEMLSQVSIFHKEAEEQAKSKDEVLQNAFMVVYWLAK